VACAALEGSRGKLGDTVHVRSSIIVVPPAPCRRS
jgi:hypothetical protein